MIKGALTRTHYVMALAYTPHRTTSPCHCMGELPAARKVQSSFLSFILSCCMLWDSELPTQHVHGGRLFCKPATALAHKQTRGLARHCLGFRQFEAASFCPMPHPGCKRLPQEELAPYTCLAGAGKWVATGGVLGLCCAGSRPSI